MTNNDYVIYLCVLTTVLPYYNELPWKIVWWDEHLEEKKHNIYININTCWGEGPHVRLYNTSRIPSK